MHPPSLTQPGWAGSCSPPAPGRGANMVPRPEGFFQRFPQCGRSRELLTLGWEGVLWSRPEHPVRSGVFKETLHVEIWSWAKADVGTLATESWRDGWGHSCSVPGAGPWRVPRDSAFRGGDGKAQGHQRVRLLQKESAGWEGFRVPGVRCGMGASGPRGCEQRLRGRKAQGARCI